MGERREGEWTPERRLDRLQWRLDALDQWRDKIEHRVSVLESEVVTEREARMLREALNANTAQQGRVRLTRLQVLGGLVIGAIALIDLLRSLVG